MQEKSFTFLHTVLLWEFSRDFTYRSCCKACLHFILFVELSATHKWWEGLFLSKITSGWNISQCSTTCCIRVSYRDGNELLLDMNLFNLEILWHNWCIMQKFLKLTAVPHILFCLLVSSIYSPCVSYSLVILPDFWGYRTLLLFFHWKSRNSKEQEQPQPSL